MRPLWIDEQEVATRLHMQDVIVAVEAAFRAWADGRAMNLPRRRVRSPGAVLHSMAATAEYLGLAGWKQYLTTTRGAVFHVGVYDLSSGECVAIVEAANLGQMRTGATTAVAVKYLTPPDLDRVALIGTGFQAAAQLQAVCCVRPIRQATVYSRQESRRREFATRMSALLGIPVAAVESARQAVQEAPLVITATTSRQPVVPDSAWTDNVTIVAIGSNWPEKTELEPVTVARAACVVCDSVEACQEEAGELIQAHRQGLWDWSRAVELRDVIRGQTAAPAAGRILFKSVGLALEDVATAALLLPHLPH